MSSADLMSSKPPLVLVHGLWDTPNVFRRLRQYLEEWPAPILTPHLPHKLGFTPLETLAQDLELAIDEAFGPDQPIDLLGFSMGAVISRTWLQLYGGHRRTRRFVSLGSPQNGTLVAQPWPRALVPGVADMKVGSALLRQLNRDSSLLRGIDCISFYCPWDLMVIPAWTGVLPVGPIVRLPVWNHRELIQSPRSLVPVSSHLLAN